MANTYNLPNAGTVITILGAWRQGQDTLLVKYQVGEDQTVKTVSGWYSATQNHYASASYDAQGGLKTGAVPRVMTSQEQLAYMQSLINVVEDSPAQGEQIV